MHPRLDGGLELGRKAVSFYTIQLTSSYLERVKWCEER